MALAGFPLAVACDISTVAIAEMNKKKRNREQQQQQHFPDLTFAVVDILSEVESTYVDEFDAVIDKGLFDAMMCDDSTATREKALRMFENLNSMMKDGAIYFCVSLAEEVRGAPRSSSFSFDSTSALLILFLF